MSLQLDAKTFARKWVAAWNSHDLDRIMSHYASNAVLTSPVVAKVMGEVSGTVNGKEALCNYFQKGLDQYPNLRFTLLDVMHGISSVVLYYTNHKGTRTAEFMEFDRNGKVVRVVANYSD